MEPLGPVPGRSTRLALVAIGLLALLAVVAFASRSGLGHGSAAAPTSGYVSYAMTIFLILFVLSIPVALYSFFMQSRERMLTPKSFRARVLRTIATTLLLAVAGSIAIYLKTHHHGFLRIEPNGLSGAAGVLKRHQGSGKASYQPQFEWTVLWIAIGLAAIGLAALVVAYRRRTRSLGPLEELPTVAEDLAASISVAIDDLEAEPDARRAVIAAYARMESVLGRHGLRRRPSETPLEYLQRILLGLTGRSAAVKRLTALFQQAKFSRHEIDLSMKHDAIAALREIRDDLRGAPA
ncbi:MAG: DUF4129 domain-containing protein [Gaiellaceae bacterium]